jgi:hypothetical protein
MICICAWILVCEYEWNYSWYIIDTYWVHNCLSGQFWTVTQIRAWILVCEITCLAKLRAFELIVSLHTNVHDCVFLSWFWTYKETCMIACFWADSELTNRRAWLRVCELIMNLHTNMHDCALVSILWIFHVHRARFTFLLWFSCTNVNVFTKSRSTSAHAHTHTHTHTHT